MIVLVVLGILTAIAYPMYQSQATENRRSDGKKILLELMSEQQKFHADNGRYTLDLVGELGQVDAGSGKVESNNKFYLVSAAICGAGVPISDCVLLTATAQLGQAGDGDLTYNSRNQKTPVEKW